MRKDSSKYASLYNTLKSDIISHKYLPGTFLPSEQELIHRYQVSRTTVRRAILELKKETLVDVHQGRPARVSQFSLGNIEKDFISIKADFQINNHFTIEEPYFTTTQASIIDEIPAPRTVAHALKLESATPVYRLQRMKLINEQAYSFDTSFVPKKLAPGLDNYSGQIHSLYQFLEANYQIKYEYGEEVISAKNANFIESRLLNIAPGAALFVLKRTSMFNGVIFEYAENIKRADLLEIVVKSKSQSMTDQN